MHHRECRKGTEVGRSIGSDIDLYHFQPFLERWNKILVLLYGSWLQDRRVVLALLQGDGVATILVVTVRRRGGEF